MSVTFTPQQWTEDPAGTAVLDMADDAERWSVNMCNRNAAHVLDTLGVDTSGELAGELAGDELLGRVLIALGIAPADERRDAYAHDEEGRFIEGAHHPGYLQERLEQLRELAEHCQARGYMIAWG
jgi:hypothetical protein